MNKLLRYWNENKIKIIITVGVIVFAFILIQIANQMVRQKNLNIANSQNNIKTEVQDVTKPNISIINNIKLDEKQVENNSKLIQTFVDYCNEHKTKEAYELLSAACKTEIYHTNHDFISNYIEKIFNKKRSYELELWKEDNNCTTYKITYNEGNPLQTGGYGNNNFIDYITVIKEGEELKLSISNFIKKEVINATQSKNKIEVSINTKSIYVNYEIYEVIIKNQTGEEILINDSKESNNICLIDTNDVEYNSYINEIAASYFLLPSGYQRKFYIKFNKLYANDREIKQLKLKDIILNYEQYQLNKASEITSKMNITVDL